MKPRWLKHAFFSSYLQNGRVCRDTHLFRHPDRSVKREGKKSLSCITSADADLLVVFLPRLLHLGISRVAWREEKILDADLRLLLDERQRNSNFLLA